MARVRAMVMVSVRIALMLWSIHLSDDYVLKSLELLVAVVE